MFKQFWNGLYIIYKNDNSLYIKLDNLVFK